MASAAQAAALQSVVGGTTNYDAQTVVLWLEGAAKPRYPERISFGRSADVRCISADAILWRLRDFWAHGSTHESLQRRLMDARGTLSKLAPFATDRYSSDFRVRGSLPWAIQRFSADILSGLLSDLVVHRSSGLPSSTISSIGMALRRASDTLQTVEPSRASHARLNVIILTFNESLRAWASIEGQEQDALSERDRIWLSLRRIRKRLARHVARIRWSYTANSAVPNAGMVVIPFVEAVTPESSLVGTTVAVSRFVRRVEGEAGVRLGMFPRQ